MPHHGEAAAVDPAALISMEALLASCYRGLVVPHPTNLVEGNATQVFTHANGLYWCCIARYKSLYYMFYNHGTPVTPDLPKVIGLARSEDAGLTWTVVNDALIDLGVGPAWDDTFIEAHCLLFMNNRFRLYYGGKDGVNWRIGFAEAPDIEGPYTKYVGNPVFSHAAPVAWDDVIAGDPHVMWYRGKYHLYYDGNTLPAVGHQVGHATSDDGITWVRDAANPIITTSGIPGTWNEDGIVYGGQLVMFNGGLMSIFHGDDKTAPRTHNIGIYTSDDGSVFTAYPGNPVLGVPLDGLMRAHPEVVLDLDKLVLFYSRADLAGTPVWRLESDLIP